MQETELKHYLSDKYQGWESFRDNVVLPIFGENNYEDNYETELLDNIPERRHLADSTSIKSIKQCASVYVNGEPLYIFDITVADRIIMKRNRVGVQTLIRSVMEHYSGAFMIFHYEEENCWQWRFSFSYKGTNDEDSTDRKRYTFLLGQGQSCRTAAQNFCNLYKERIDNKHLQFNNIINAFSVEALSDEFFNGYKAIYADIIFYITGKRMVKQGNKWEEVKEGRACRKILDEFSDFADPEKSVRDYVKKLMGRLVFLQFLQKKGWLGVPLNEDWGNGDPEFLQNLFANTKDKDNFVDNVLGIIFKDLNTEREGDKSKKYKFKIPYLNGGLFERDAADKTNFPLPAKYMEELLEFFSRYNFTIDENDPNDAEVGVDPEMLGRIFENLLEDNRDKGVFYTPKEIVQYMCRESLIAYLQTDQNEEYKESIRQFVTTHNAEILGRIKEDIDKKLQNVKICDPAIGSGAFPMGLLKELYLCRSAIESIHEDKASEIKKHIIQHNIYGVDIEKGAVDIARLRFWLSLIVDERTPHALPNLDFKIMQGNSLLERYKGADLSTTTESKYDKEKGLSFYDNMVDAYRKELRNMLAEYYKCVNHQEKGKLHKSIINNVKEQLSEQYVNVDFGDLNLAGNDQFFLWHTWFYDVFSQGGFDILIGNPPYIKEYTNRNAFDIFRESSPYYMGKMDLWYGFACHGIDLLRENGFLCFIAQNNWTTSAGAKKMRNKVISDTQIIQMLDFNTYMVFENADIQTMVMLFQHNPNNDNYNFDYRLITHNNEKDDMLALLAKQQRNTKYICPKIKRENYIDKLLTFSDNNYLLEKIAEHKTYLLNEEATNGIHTHHDCVTNKIHTNFPDLQIGKGIFVLSSDEKKNLHLSPKEYSLVKPFFTSEEILQYWTNPQNKSWIIYTSSEYKDKHSLDGYPNIKKHLDIVKKCITSDNKPYGLHRSREERFFKGEKIVSQRKCVGRPCFSYSAFDCYVPAMYYIIKTSRWNMKFLTGVLNSKLVAFWLRYKGKMQGNNYQVDKEPLLGIPLPEIELNSQKPVIKLIDQILSTKEKSIDNDTSNIEHKIDEIVYQLYDLTDDEIKIIERAVE